MANNLTQLWIYLGENNNKITDKGLEYVAKALSKITHLKDLAFVIPNCDSISDYGAMAVIINGIGKLKQLTGLLISFWECTNLTD